MSNGSRRLTRAAASILMVTAAIAVWQVAGDGDAARSRAAAWVKRHPAVVGLSLAALNQYPETYQDAIYESLPPAQKLRVWREFLATSATSERLTPMKRDVLARVSQGMRVEDFLRGGERRPAMRHLLEEAEAVLGRQFSLLGSGAWRRVTFVTGTVPGNPGEMLRVAPLHLADWLLRSSVVQAVDDCDCWVPEEGKYDCASRDGYWKYCSPSVQGRVCNERGDGYYGPCGLYDTRPCDGACTWVATGGGGGGSGGGGSGGGCCAYSEGNYCDASCRCCEAV